MATSTAQSLGRHMLNKVPEATVFFWIIKILCTTVGESFSDYLNETLGWGIPKTFYATGAILVVFLVLQFRSRKYVPFLYWTSVVFISIVGTLATDYLTDEKGVPLPLTTSIFAVLLALVFAVWYRSEGTLSIHTIHTTGREAFYWLTVFVTFALGTAAGDLMVSQFNLTPLAALLIFAAAIAVVAVAHFGFHMNAVLSFWLAYILTRPLGASTGDFLASDKTDGGLGLGTTATSYIFLALILALVIYLTITRKDATEKVLGPEAALAD